MDMQCYCMSIFLLGVNMKRILLVLLISFVAFGLSAQVKFSGSTGSTAYINDTLDGGVLDADQDITIAFAPLSLALNAGYTRDFAALSNVISFGYMLTAAHAFGPVALTATAASNALAQTIGGAFAGDFLGDMTAKMVLSKDIVSATVYGLFTAKKGYPFFMGVDTSVSIAPKWGSFTVGTLMLDAKAVTDDVGYANAVAAVEGLSFYAKAKVTY
jgi:hypothetical protein